MNYRSRAISIALLVTALSACGEPVTPFAEPDVPDLARLALTPVPATNVEVVSTTGVRMVDMGINGLAFDVNNAGVVVGSIVSGQGWRWTNGTAVYIGARTAGAQSDARSINNTGDIAGWASNFIDRVAVVLPVGSETLQRVGAIAQPNTFPNESASEILDNGAVVGSGIGSQGLRSAFLGNVAQQSGVELARLGTGPCLAHGADLVPDRRIAIVGQCTTDRTEATAWLDGNNDGMPDVRSLTSLPGVSIAYDIHEFEAVGVINGKPYIMPLPTVSGPPLLSLALPTLVLNGNGAAEDINGLYIVGNNVASDGQQHAVIWTDRYAVPTDLGTLPGDVRSYAYAVNESGVTVGYSQNAAGRFRAVVWYPSTTPENTAPAATINTPLDGATAVAGTTVTLSGSALDAEDGALDGTSLTWSSSLNGPLGTGSTLGTSALSVGTHTLTLTATDSDGATGEASVAITITPVPNAAPVVTIVSPADGAEYQVGSNIIFTASATDAEDGALSGAALRWHSSLEGDLGTGSIVSTAALRAGEHRIEVIATDADDATATAAITVHITVPTGLAANLAAVAERIAQLVAINQLGPNGSGILEALRNAERFVAEGNLNGARGALKAVTRGLLPASLRESTLSTADQQALTRNLQDLLRELGG